MKNGYSIFKNTSFRVKIFAFIFLAVFSTTLFVSYILYSKAESSITSQYSRVVSNSIDFSISNIDESLKLVNGIGDLILTENDFISTAKIKDVLTEQEKVKKYGRIRDLLNYFTARIKNLNIAPGMDSFYIYLVNQNTIIDSKTTYYENIKKDNVDFINKYYSNNYKDTWFVSTPVDFYTLNDIETRFEQSKVISFYKEIKDENNNLIAILTMNLSESYIADYYKKVQRGIPGDSIILNESGSIIAHSDKKNVGAILGKYNELNKKIDEKKSKSGSLFVKIGEESQFVVYFISQYTKWKFIVLIPSNDIMGGIYQIKNFFLIIIFLTLLIIIAITYLVSGIFYKPLDKLVNAMQEIENRNLNMRIDDKRKDEYQKVFSGFNKMVIELRNLINDLTSEKILKKEAEIKLLQAQINPHFLYNTLDSIYSIARIKKVDEISKMVYALSKFFRISLSGGKEFVTLREALDLAINYLTIQNIRFKGRIDYDVEISQDLMDFIVPKLILQPIVENSINHGLENVKSDGKITISAQIIDNTLYINVKDNGTGIEKSELYRINDSLLNEKTDEQASFALRNLNKQIKMKYGNAFGIELESELNIGTKTIVRLPLIQK